MKLSQSSRLAGFILVVAIGGCGDGSETAAVTKPTQPVVANPLIAPVAPVTPTVAPVALPVNPGPAVATVKPGSVGEALATGRGLLDKEDFAGARDVLLLGVALSDKDAELQVELGRAYLGLGDLSRAAVAAKKATKLSPKSSAAWNTLGRVERSRYRYDQAREAFSTAIDLNEDNIYAWNNLGLTLLELGLFQEAVNALEEATSRGKPSGYMWNNLGIAYEHLDMLDEARVAYEQGGVAGSVAAKASRKRLEGVNTIHLATVADESGAVIDEAAVVEEMVNRDVPVVDDSADVAAVDDKGDS